MHNLAKVDSPHGGRGLKTLRLRHFYLVRAGFIFGLLSLLWSISFSGMSRGFVTVRGLSPSHSVTWLIGMPARLPHLTVSSPPVRGTSDDRMPAGWSARFGRAAVTD